MVNTFQAIVVVLVGLLPGALYVWAFERQAGRWGIGLSDRVLRFVGGSAIFHAVFASVTYRLWSDHADDLRAGRALPSWVAAVPVAYVAVPAVLGTAVGIYARRGSAWTRLFTGKDPAPRAWDYLFQGTLDGWIRIRMKSGAWIGGAYAEANGRRSYAAGYPEPQDLYLAAAVNLDPDTGEFEFQADGTVELLPGGLLVRWDEVEYLEFIDA